MESNLTPAARSAHAVGAHDAKTNLGRLLDRVEQGESIVITRHGEPIARLVPYEEAIDTARVQRAIDDILGVQRAQTLAGVSIEELINDGRSSA